MTLMAGNILEGTVVNITNFGAFVEIEGKTGLVHISEVADSFVKDIRQHLNEQDKVKVYQLMIMVKLVYQLSKLTLRKNLLSLQKFNGHLKRKKLLQQTLKILCLDF